MDREGLDQHLAHVLERLGGQQPSIWRERPVRLCLDDLVASCHVGALPADVGGSHEDPPTSTPSGGVSGAWARLPPLSWRAA